MNIANPRVHHLGKRHAGCRDKVLKSRIAINRVAVARVASRERNTVVAVFAQKQGFLPCFLERQQDDIYIS